MDDDANILYPGEQKREEIPQFLDITAPKMGVQIDIRSDGKVIWVSVDGITVLRVCQIPRLIIKDNQYDANKAQLLALLKERAALKKSKVEVKLDEEL